MAGTAGWKGSLHPRVIRAPRPGLLWKVKNFSNVWRGLLRHRIAQTLGMNHMLGCLYAVKLGGDGKVKCNYGLISTNLVTDAFVEFIVDQLIAETSEFGDFKYHDSGVGVTGAAVGDTDIETTDGESRVAGTQAEDSSKVYESVATIAYSSTKSITEHGLFSQSSGTTLMDRHVFGVLSMENGDSIQFTYQLTCTSGG